MNSSSVPAPVIRSASDHRLMSKENGGRLTPGLGTAPDGPPGDPAAGGRAGEESFGCCSGAYHLPSDACHQPAPWETSPIASSWSFMRREVFPTAKRS